MRPTDFHQLIINFRWFVLRIASSNSVSSWMSIDIYRVFFSPFWLGFERQVVPSMIGRTNPIRRHSFKYGVLFAPVIMLTYPLPSTICTLTSVCKPTESTPEFATSLASTKSLIVDQPNIFWKTSTDNNEVHVNWRHLAYLILFLLEAINQKKCDGFLYDHHGYLAYGGNIVFA